MRSLPIGYRWMRHPGIELGWILCWLDRQGRISHAMLHLTHGRGDDALLLTEDFWRHDPT